jgi:putative ABC transport system permease protein
MLTDARFAFRLMRRAPAFSAAAIIMLALGIGASTAMFSVSEALLLRPLTYPDGDRLVALQHISPDPGFPYQRAAPGSLADWQNESTLFEAIAGYRWHTIDVIDAEQSERLTGLFVTPEFFDVFGVPLVGRGFLQEDRDTRAIVLGHEVSRRRFNDGNALVGSAIDLNVRNLRQVGPTRHTVVGVAAAPARFPPLTEDFHLGLANVVETIDFWTPEFVSSTSTRGAHEFDVVGKLRAGVTVAQAQQEMDRIARRQGNEYPGTNRGWRIRVVPLRERIAGEARDATLLLATGTGMLLLIACANVATLLLSRGAVRHREVAIRASLGATRWRVMRQFLMESIVLAGLAGVLGVILAMWTISAARPWLPARLPILQDTTINPTVLGFALICVLATACLSGIIPAMRSARAGQERLTGGEGRGVTLNRARTRLIGVLVSVEVTLTVMLFLSAGLLIRSVLHTRTIDPGFNPAGVLTMTISLPENKFEWNHNAVFARDVVSAVRSLTSVEDAAVVQGIPMREGSFYASGVVDGYLPRSAAEEPIWRVRVVSPEYWSAMQIPLLSGRRLEERDGEGERGFPRNVVISRSFASRYWPGEDALGKRIGIDQARAGLRARSEIWWMTVVGVAGDVRYAGLETDPTLDVYYPQALFPQAAITLIVRTPGDPLNRVADVRARIRGVDEHALVSDVRTMEQVIAASQANRRAGTLLVTVFSAIGLVLVLAGVYSVIAQSVVQRRVEMAIRVAFGATRSRIIALGIQTTVLPAIVGMALGLVGGSIATRVIATMLFGVTPFDLPTWMAVCLLVLAACLAAAYVPARRGADVDPMTALRSE